MVVQVLSQAVKRLLVDKVNSQKVGGQFKKYYQMNLSRGPTNALVVSTVIKTKLKIKSH
jgi:hypothetical protein